MINFGYPKRDISYSIPFYISGKNKDIIKYAIESYGYIIQRKDSLTFKEFAEEIKKIYDCENNIKNKEIYRILSNMEDAI